MIKGLGTMSDENSAGSETSHWEDTNTEVMRSEMPHG